MNIIYRLNQDPERPTQVTYAVLFLYALLVFQIALYLVQNIVFCMTFSEQFELGTVVFDILVFALATWLVFVVARKIEYGKNWARWLLLIGFVFIVITSLCGIQTLLEGDAIRGISVLSQVIVTGMAVTLLFQPSSSRWFSSKKRAVSLADLNNDSEVVVNRTEAETHSNPINRLNLQWPSQSSSQQKGIFAAAILYGVVRGLALWGPHALLIFPAEPIGSIQPTSLGQKLMIFAAGSFVAIVIGLPLTYFVGKRSIIAGVLVVGGAILLVSLVLTTLAGM